ncbi:hypothetical protein SAMN05216277_11712 [Halolamina pelagica]|uniref:Uncharacterized protein n=2 Tax=Haloferacaceae TaxID=1644056 RepID=A0A1I5VB06_9EURY|nr:hypothetical protein SAMN05216277_11712 [Halolamina pelagica]
MGTTTEMSRTIRRAALFALYQITVLLGIALLPVAMFTRRLGVPLPLGRAVDGAKAAYETTE